MKWFWLGGLLCCAACARIDASQLSWGLPHNGMLIGGEALQPVAGVLSLARPRDSTRYGTTALITALGDAATAVTRQHPGGVPLRVGDVAAPRGGKHPRHRSHRTGRDVDVMFFMLDRDDKSVRSKAFAIDRFGVAVRGDNKGSPVFFDTPRNWAFVRSLISNDALRTQWIFVSRGVKSLLLRHALDVEKDPEILTRAAWILHQPTNGRSHNDHFHIRVACGPRSVALGCVDPAPHWPWWREHAKLPTRAPSLSDSAVVSLLTAADQLAE